MMVTNDCEQPSGIVIKAKKETDIDSLFPKSRPLPNGMGYDTWFHQLKVGDKVETYNGRIEIIRKKYSSYMLGFDADGRTNCAPDGYFPIAIAGCYPVND